MAVRILCGSGVFFLFRRRKIFYYPVPDKFLALSSFFFLSSSSIQLFPCHSLPCKTHNNLPLISWEGGRKRGGPLLFLLLFLLLCLHQSRRVFRKKAKGEKRRPPSCPFISKLFIPWKCTFLAFFSELYPPHGEGGTLPLSPVNKWKNDNKQQAKRGQKVIPPPDGESPNLTDPLPCSSFRLLRMPGLHDAGEEPCAAVDGGRYARENRS